MNASATIASDVAATRGLIVQPDARNHCEKNNLLRLVEIAGEIISRQFTLAGPIEVELQFDPDADEETVLLVFPVAATVEETTKQHSRYIEEWLSCVHGDDRLLISIIPSIVENTNASS